jgi:hypothetical protein
MVSWSIEVTKMATVRQAGFTDISNNVCGVKGFLSVVRHKLRGVVSMAL